jgi:hypothetical protein
MKNEHFDRVKEGANNVYNLQNLSKFVEKHLYLEGKRYEFGEKYGFQATIIDDTSRVTNTVKPAQIGLTVSTMAYIVSAACTQKKFNSIYSLPTSNDAQKLVATKLDPLIQGSPEAKRLLDYNVDNSELKKLGNNFIFVRGSKSETAALSISADALVADEIDRSDPDTLKQFRSRLQASELQIIKQFSTPTMEGVGISKEAETSKRYRHMAKCDCCGNVWLPSYHSDIVIPKFLGDIKEITKETIKDVRWQDAHWKCPACGEDPKLHPRNLEWVCENPLDNYEANTYFVTPVTACLVLKPAYLVRTSTEFNTKSEWANQVLGETSEEENEQITLQDLDKAEVEASLDSSEVHYFGADMGLMCAIAIGRMAQDGTLIVVHREMVPISSFETRRRELLRQYRCVNSVHDVMPYASEIMRITEADPNAYGAIFTTGKSPELYTLQEKDENLEEGKLNLRLLKVNRTVGLDAVRDLFKQGRVVMRKTDETQKLREQYLSLKRIQQFVKEELVYVWQKTGKENDHMHFALLYLLLAIKLRGRTQGWVKAGAVPLVTRYRSKVDV